MRTAQSGSAPLAHPVKPRIFFTSAGHEFTVLVKTARRWVRAMDLQSNPFDALRSVEFNPVQCTVPKAAPPQPGAHKQSLDFEGFSSDAELAPTCWNTAQEKSINNRRGLLQRWIIKFMVGEIVKEKNRCTTRLLVQQLQPGKKIFGRINPGKCEHHTTIQTVWKAFLPVRLMGYAMLTPEKAAWAYLYNSEY